MSIFKRTIVDKIELDAQGVVGVRLAKQLVDDSNGLVLASNWHRTILNPGDDTGAQLLNVNAHLVSMNEAELEAVEWLKVTIITNVVWTPELVAAWQAAHPTQVIED